MRVNAWKKRELVTIEFRFSNILPTLSIQPMQPRKVQHQTAADSSHTILQTILIGKPPSQYSNTFKNISSSYVRIIYYIGLQFNLNMTTHHKILSYLTLSLL